MGKKENRPVACAASGTASTCDYDSTFVSAGQDMTENELIRTVTEEYLAGIDADIRPAPEDVERELLQATNNAIEAYNLGPRDPNAPVGAKQQDAYPDQKKGDARLRLRKHLDPYQIALVVRELHHAVGIRLDDSNSNDNFDIGVYQFDGVNEGTYDTSRLGLERLIRSYDMAISARNVDETVAVLRSICPVRQKTEDSELVAVNNGVYDYGSKMLLGFDPEFVFTGKSHVDFVEGAKNPVIHNDDDGTDWDVESWMEEFSDDPAMVNLLWQVVGATLRPNVTWNKTAWLYSDSGNNGKGTLCTLMRNMLEEFKLENDPVRQFAEEVFAEATWDLLPYKFMYDCYRHWFQRNVPSGRPVGRNAFLKSLKGLAAEYGWLAQDKVRSDGRMDRPEPLILEYDVREWMNSGYTGSDPGRMDRPDLAESYRGFVRVSTAGSDEGNETDSEDKED